MSLSRRAISGRRTVELGHTLTTAAGALGKRFNEDVLSICMQDHLHPVTLTVELEREHVLRVVETSLKSLIYVHKRTE